MASIVLPSLSVIPVDSQVDWRVCRGGNRGEGTSVPECSAVRRGAFAEAEPRSDWYGEGVWLVWAGHCGYLGKQAGVGIGGEIERRGSINHHVDHA
jgi:hypothetical protein